MKQRIIEYVDPWPGRNKDGSPVTCTHITRLTEEDAVKVSRENVYRKHPEFALALTDKSLLDDFIVVNWATVKEVDVEDSPSRTTESAEAGTSVLKEAHAHSADAAYRDGPAASENET